MKRIYACIAIVGVLLSVAFYSSWKVQSFADVISADLDTAAEAIRNANYPAPGRRLLMVPTVRPNAHQNETTCCAQQILPSWKLRCGRRTDTWKWVPQRKPLVSCAAHRYRWKHWNGSRTGWYKQKHRPAPLGESRCSDANYFCGSLRSPSAFSAH